MDKVPKYQKPLKDSFSIDDISWIYRLPDLPSNLKDDRPTESDDFVILKHLSFVTNDSRSVLALTFNKQKLNRILPLDRPSKFCSVSFTGFKFMENGANKTADYIEKFLTTGIKLNDTIYKFFGWSNSQLKSRFCLLYAFAPNEDPLRTLNNMGDFNDINTVAKKSKCISLLFSEAELGIKLFENQFRDYHDIERDGHVFTDGCGLMPLNFAHTIARRKKIIFSTEHGIR